MPVESRPRSVMHEQPARRFFGHLLGGFADLADGAEPAVQVCVLRREKYTGAGASGAHAQRFDTQIDAELRQQGSCTVRHAPRNMRRQIGGDRAPKNTQQRSALFEFERLQRRRAGAQTQDMGMHLPPSRPGTNPIRQAPRRPRRRALRASAAKRHARSRRVGSTPCACRRAARSGCHPPRKRAAAILSAEPA